MMAKVVSENQRDWDQWLPSVMAAYRATVHEATEFTPNMLFLGRENYAPLDLMIGVPDREVQAWSPNEFVAKRQERMKVAYAMVRNHLGTHAVARKRYYDMRVRMRKFTPGEWVWLFQPRRYNTNIA